MSDLHKVAVAAVDKWVTVHCIRDAITLTHGSMMDLAYVITNCLHAELAAAEARITELEAHCGRLESEQQLDEMNDTIQSLHAQLQGAKNRIAELEATRSHLTRDGYVP